MEESIKALIQEGLYDFDGKERLEKIRRDMNGKLETCWMMATLLQSGRRCSDAHFEEMMDYLTTALHELEGLVNGGEEETTE